MALLCCSMDLVFTILCLISTILSLIITFLISFILCPITTIWLLIVSDGLLISLWLLWDVSGGLLLMRRLALINVIELVLFCIKCFWYTDSTML